MKSIILRDDTNHLGEIRDHESVFCGLDFGYPEAEKIIIAQLCESIDFTKDCTDVDQIIPKTPHAEGEIRTR